MTRKLEFCPTTDTNFHFYRKYYSTQNSDLTQLYILIAGTKLNIKCLVYFQFKAACINMNQIYFKRNKLEKNVLRF
jgi:hypothetical protein